MNRQRVLRSGSFMAVVLSLGVVASGCGVPQSQYDAALADAAGEKAKNAELAKELEALRAQPAKPAEKSPDADQAQLDELKKQKAAAEARAKTMDDLVKRFRKMIDAGKLDITMRHGQIVLALETDILFDPGKTDVKPEGQTALKEIGDAIKQVPGRRFQVAGHTDTTPIKTKEYPSNWELSTARSVVVVKLLVGDGVRASTLSAAGFAEYDPVGNNATNDGRAKNRRIEIVLLPNIEELIAVPGLVPPEATKKDDKKDEKKDDKKDEKKDDKKPGTPPKK